MPDFDQILEGLEKEDQATILKIQALQDRTKKPEEVQRAKWEAFVNAFPDEDDFIQKFFWIKTKDPDVPLIRLRYNSPQRRLNALIKELQGRGKLVRIVMLKCRQWGGSTFIQAKKAYRVLTKAHFRAAVIAHDDAATQEIFDMTDRFCHLLPFLPPMRGRTVNEIKTDIGAKYTTVTAGSRNQGHGMTSHWVHLSEFARYPNADEIKTGVLQTIGRKHGTAVIVESTANGMGGLGGPFYNLCQNARSGESDWVFFFVPWHENDDYFLFQPKEEADKIQASLSDDEKWLQQKFDCTVHQLAWRRAMMKTECDNNPERFKEQYPAFADEAFLTSGSPVFDMQRIQDLMAKARDPIMRGQLIRQDKPTPMAEV